MIVQLEKQIDPKKLKNILEKFSEIKYKVSEVRTQYNHYLVGTGKLKKDIRIFGSLDGVQDIHYVDDPYQLVSRMWKTKNSEIDLGDGVKIGAENFSIMAGPCSIEDEGQVDIISDFLINNGIKILRGGVFKPRTSPYAYRGGGIEALKMVYEICSAKGIKIISEVMQESQIEAMYPYVDVFQVGTRNAQNYNLLDALGTCDKPVMLKRGMSGTIDELLQSAEYVFSGGNEKIILCERGIRTFEKAYRNTFDINAIAVLKDKSHLPVIADPSHGIGVRKHVDKIAMASKLAGADGVIIEIHPCPEKALSDGDQTLDFNEMSVLTHKLNRLDTLMREESFL